MQRCTAVTEDVNWDDLRFVLALARQGTLVAAGKTLGTSHTTVLRRLRSLEAQLGTTLFDRTSTGWATTHAGVRLAEEAERVEATLAAAVRAVSGEDAGLFGAVTITAPEGVAQELLPPLLAELLAAHPRLRFDLRVGQQVADLGQREADLAVRFMERPPETLVGRRIGRSQLLPCASPAYLAGRDAVFPNTPEGHRFLIVPSAPSPAYEGLGLGTHPESVLSVDCFVTAAELCRRGLGIAEVPDFLARRDPDLVGAARRLPACAHAGLAAHARRPPRARAHSRRRRPLLRTASGRAQRFRRRSSRGLSGLSSRPSS